MKEIDNLTRDVLAAEAAGFGPWYGRYIAAYGHVRVPTPETPQTQKKTAVCPHCGKTFIQKDKWPKKYCSADCIEESRRKQQYAHAERKRAEKSVCAASPG